MKTLENIVTKCVKGQFLTIVTETSIQDMNGKQLKKSPYMDVLRKQTTYRSVRFCDYENLASTKEKREQGIEAVKPTWWEWVVFPYIARHKTNGTKYLVVKPIENEIPQSEYFEVIEREPIAKDRITPISTEMVKPYLKKTSSSGSSVYMLKLDSIIYLSQGSILYRKG